MRAALVGCVFVLVWWLVPAKSGRVLQRLASPERAETLAASRPRVPWIESRPHRAVICALACSAFAWALGGPWLALVGGAGGLGLSWWLGGLEAPSVVKVREEIRRDLPLAVDLLAACSLAGRPVEQSLELVSRSVGGALRARLRPTIARLTLGADPVPEWRRLAADPELATLARVLTRSLESGAPLGESLARLADDCRRARRTETQVRARAVGVKAAGPLALCFLPAFMLIGVVPTVAGAFANLIL